MLSRIGLFLATNLAVMLVLTVVIEVLRSMGLDQALAEQGISFDTVTALIFAGLFGFGGSLISLFLSKWMAKRAFKVQIIEQPANETEAWLVSTVQRQAERAGVGMPEVGIAPSPAMNAFATGWNRNNALVCVTAGLLQNMTRDEVEGVLAHEVSHVANGDMVTMALVQGVLNTFVIFFARIIGTMVDSWMSRGQNRGRGIGYFVGVIVAEIVLGILASIITMAYSRWREYHADSGGADLAGRQKMIAALRRLQQQHDKTEPLPDAHRAFGIVGFRGMFLSHPPLEKRIAALEARGLG